MKRRDLAKMANIDPSYVTLIERDGYIPRIDVVQRVARALNVSLDDCCLAAGYATEHVARVYRQQVRDTHLDLEPALRQQLRRMASLNPDRQRGLAKSIKSILEVSNV
jgi:transcriptional regulator with XRE-family HTH domain